MQPIPARKDSSISAASDGRPQSPTKLLKKPPETSSAIWACEFSKDGRYLAVAGQYTAFSKKNLLGGFVLDLKNFERRQLIDNCRTKRGDNALESSINARRATSTRAGRSFVK